MSSISLIRWLETSTVRPSSASAAQQLAHPADALGVQAVDRLVEQQDVGVAEQGGGDAEPLPHAEREAAHPVVGDGLQADQLDHLVHPRAGQPVALRERQQMPVGGPAGMPGARVDQRADPAHRLGQLAVGPAEHRRRPGGRAGPGRGRSASSSSCPSRWGRGSR